MTKTNPSDSSEPNAWRQMKRSFISGAVAGGASTAVLHPLDKALYNAITNGTSFWNPANFTAPFGGIGQAVVMRMGTHGVYFVLQKQIKTTLPDLLNGTPINQEKNIHFITGLAAGSISGVLSSPISAIKYYSWRMEHPSFLKSVNNMWNQNGYKPFIRGARATLFRDASYGCIYEFLRNQLLEYIPHKFTCDLLAAMVGTAVVSPINYVRLNQYAAPVKEKEPAIMDTMFRLFKESKNQAGVFSGKYLYQKLKLGPGTVRAAFGMALGQMFFDKTIQFLSEESTDEVLVSTFKK